MPTIAWLLALAAALCFATALITTQYGLKHLGPRRGAMISVPVSTVLFWIAAPFALAGWDLRAAVIFAAIGLFFPAAVTLLTYEANRRAGPHVAGALGNLAPLFAVLAAVLILGEAPGPQRLAGIVVIVAGVTLLSADRHWLAERWPLWVLALPLAAAGIRGLVQPAVKLGLETWPSPFAAALIGYSVSAIVVLAQGSMQARTATGFPRAGIVWFAATGIANGMAVLLMYGALSQGPVSLVAPVVALYPLATLAIGLTLPGSRAAIRAHTIAGVAVTVIGAGLLLAA